MSWRDKICTALGANSQVATLVGDRIYPEIAPDDAPLPCLVYALISQETSLEHDGDADFDAVQIQVTAWANTVAEAEAARNAARLALSGLAPGGGIIGPINPQSPRILRDDRFHGALIEFAFFIDPLVA